MSMGFRRFWLRDIRYHFLGDVVCGGHLLMRRRFVHLVQVDRISWMVIRAAVSVY